MSLMISSYSCFTVGSSRKLCSPTFLCKMSEVAEFFRGRAVLVTGASGFMGKVLVEKLLYSCSDLRAIYILMRKKRNKAPEVRTEEMLKLPLFHRLRNEKPDALNKLVPVHGDVTLEDLGLTPEAKTRLQDEVSVVFHCAATLRLEAKLKDATEMNTAGTWRLLQLARGMIHLKAFVHLSTAFCHCDQDVLEERIYESPLDPHDVMRCVQWMDETMLSMITERLIAPHPNTYTYTKRLAECLVGNHCPDLPVVIARPAIVTPTFKEPMPGWVDSLNGPIGLLVGGGKGVIRSMHCKGEYQAEVVPVDMAISGLIAIAWRTGTSENRPDEVPVYNITSSSVKRITFKDMLDKGRAVVHDNPFEMMLWYPDGNIRSSKLVHNIYVIFLHFLPAYFIDLLLLLCRQKRFMVRLQYKIQDGLEVLQYFTTRKWNFRSAKFCALRKELNPVDREIFFTDFEAVDDDEYMVHTVLGARQYCLKEPLSSLPRCRRNLKILYVVDRICSALFYLFLAWMVFSYSETARQLLDASTEYLSKMPLVRSFVSFGDM